MNKTRLNAVWCVVILLLHAPRAAAAECTAVYIQEDSIATLLNSAAAVLLCSWKSIVSTLLALICACAMTYLAMRRRKAIE